MTLDAIVTAALGDLVPGAAVAVVHGGETTRICRGLADLEWNAPVSPTTVFRLASVSKPFTALTVCSLAADGLIELDAPAGEYVPGFTATVRQLLSHTGGVADFVAQPGFAARSRLDHTDKEVLALFAGLPPDFAPGSDYGYSGSGYRLLDMIVARVTGRPFAEVLAERVLEPAGMKRTMLLDDAAIVPERARGYAEGPVNAPYVSMSIPGGAGGLGSTLDDLLLFDTALRDGVLGSPEMYHRSPLTDGTTIGYGLGWTLTDYRGAPVHSHAGAINGFTTIYARLPEHDTSVIVLANLQGFGAKALARALIDAVLPLPPREHGTGGGDPAHAGVYANSWWELEVTADGGDLVFEGERFHPAGPGVYAKEGDPDVYMRFEGATLTVESPLMCNRGRRR